MLFVYEILIQLIKTTHRRLIDNWSALKTNSI